MSINIAVIMGRLTADPELKTTQSGVSVTTFAVAVDKKRQPQGEEKKASFIDVVAWRSAAEFVCKYFKKGSPISIEGEIQTRNYTDKEGKNRKTTELVADHISFCGSKSDNTSQDAATPASTAEDTFTDASDGDLPF